MLSYLVYPVSRAIQAEILTVRRCKLGFTQFVERAVVLILTPYSVAVQDACCIGTRRPKDDTPFRVAAQSTYRE